MTNAKDVKAYYNSKESRLGYTLFLRGAKHFGFYESNDKSYHFGAALRKMERKIGEALNLKPACKVLDAGCGMGVVSRNLAKWFGYDITGIDILTFNLNAAQKQAALSENKELNLQYMEMDYHSLTFSEQSFDGVYTTETFVHAQNPEQVLKEFYRVLKPHGRLVQLEYSHDPYSTMSKEDHKTFELINDLAAMPAFNLFEHGTHERMLQEAGFQVISSTNYAKNIEPMLKWFMIVAWLPVKIIRLVRLERKFANAIAAVDFWRLRHKIRVNIIVAEKP